MASSGLEAGLELSFRQFKQRLDMLTPALIDVTDRVHHAYDPVRRYIARPIADADKVPLTASAAQAREAGHEHCGSLATRGADRRSALFSLMGNVSNTA